MSDRGQNGLNELQRRFLDAAVAAGVLQFGDFTLRSGRNSPYFFNLATFSDGRSCELLGECYAGMIAEFAESRDFDLLFGPAYKGIVLVVSAAQGLQQHHRLNCAWAFNRKEAKNHGEGGQLVGAPVAGRRVLLVDDVISAGSAAREALSMLTAAGAETVGLVVALNRQERGLGRLSAAAELEQEFGITVASLVNLDDLVNYAQTASQVSAPQLERMRAYRERYGGE